MKYIIISSLVGTQKKYKINRKNRTAKEETGTLPKIKTHNKQRRRVRETGATNKLIKA